MKWQLHDSIDCLLEMFADVLHACTRRACALDFFQVIIRYIFIFSFNNSNAIFFSCNRNIAWLWGRRGSDRMVVGFTTTYASGAYDHWCCEFESRSRRGVQHYVIKFVSDLRQVVGFLGSSGFLHHITEILLKVALNTIKQSILLVQYMYQ